MCILRKILSLVGYFTVYHSKALHNHCSMCIHVHVKCNRIHCTFTSNKQTISRMFCPILIISLTQEIYASIPIILITYQYHGWQYPHSCGFLPCLTYQSRTPHIKKLELKFYLKFKIFEIIITLTKSLIESFLMCFFVCLGFLEHFYHQTNLAQRCKCYAIMP